MLLAFTPLRGNRKLRLLWQLLLVGALGIWAGQLVSLALVVGWAQHGVPWRTAPGLVLLVTAALLIPWSSRRQLYCHHLCPHGAAQSLLGAMLRKRWTLPPVWHRWLSRLPGLLLVVAVFLVAWRTKSGVSTDLTLLEPFDAWGWRAAAWISLGLALVGLVASLFVPQAYCHYGCPTGALLKFIRSPGRHDRFGKMDGWAVLVLGVSWWITQA
jgi:NosR/NirI family nitrous oxide reductase transcriptional regulator